MPFSASPSRLCRPLSCAAREEVSLVLEFCRRRRLEMEPDEPWWYKDGDVCDEGVGAGW